MPKHTTVSIALPSRTAILQLEQRLDEEQVSSAKGQAGEDTTTHWESNVQLGSEYDEKRAEGIALFAQSRSIWSVALGKITLARRIIELLEGSKPVCQPPYLAGHRKREFEGAKVGTMLEGDLVEICKAEWAILIVVVPKKDGKLRFCVE